MIVVVQVMPITKWRMDENVLQWIVWSIHRILLIEVGGILLSKLQISYVYWKRARSRRAWWRVQRSIQNDNLLHFIVNLIRTQRKWLNLIKFKFGICFVFMNMHFYPYRNLISTWQILSICTQNIISILELPLVPPIS